MKLETSDYVYVVSGLLIIVLGLFGNAMTFACYNLIKKRSCRTHRLYIQTLTICDTVVLLIGLLRKLIVVAAGRDVALASDITCKLLNSIGYYASHLSVWTLVGASWERFTAVAFPLKSSAKSAEKLVMVVVVVLFAVVDGHHMFTDGIVIYQYTGGSNDTQKSETEPMLHASCRYLDDYVFLETIWPIVDVISYSIAPFLAIGTLNALIIYHMRASKRAFDEIKDGETVRTVVDRKSTIANKVDRKTKQLCIHQTCGLQQKGLEKLPSGSFFCSQLTQPQREHRLTRMLLVFSFSFILLTSPNALLIVVSRFAFTHQETADAQEETVNVHFVLAYEAVEILMYFHHACLFFLYCALSVTFRKHVTTVLSQCRSDKTRIEARGSRYPIVITQTTAGRRSSRE